MSKDKIFQTDVDWAEHLFDENGVPILHIKGIGKVRHPGWIAIYALQYAGLESYAKEKAVNQDMEKFRACVNWLATNWSENKKGDLVWLYNFDSTYNDVFIKAPWYSAFAQAVAIEALIASYKIDGNTEHLALAERAASVLFRPIEDGGLLFQKGDDIWFEEMPVPKENPTHILNGHMRTLIALKELAEATGKSEYQDWFDRGAKTLEQWLPLYDNGYWLRYDLNPKKDELLFRFTNPYGFKLTELAIDKITLRDPKSGEEVSLDVGAPVDPEGQVRIAGNDWGQSEVIDGRTVRRLRPVTPATAQEEADGDMHAPGTYFYLRLPSKWNDNLRQDWFELIIDYKDENPGNVAIQMRSIAPGPAFRDLRDGDLLLSGSGQWRQWRIPLRTTDLGWWVGESYAEKHVLYLEELAEINQSLKTWANVARGYFNLTQAPKVEPENIVKVEPAVLPKQTPMLSIYSFDENMVVRQHIAGPSTELVNGFWDSNTEGGPPVYSPYVVAEQASMGTNMFKYGDLMDISVLDRVPNYKKNYDWVTNNNLNRINKEPAFEWLRRNANILGDSLIWLFPFSNTYNDVSQEEYWQSAFAQKYVIDAFMSIGDKEIVKKAVPLLFHVLASSGLISKA